jgi:DNA polymerase-3 subunit beta
MRVVIAQSDLLEGLKTVSRAVSGANTLPILGNILIKAEGRKMSFSATNLDISIQTTLEADVQNEGAITVPSKILTSYVSLLGKDAETELKVGDGLALEIKSGGSQTKIKGLSADEFPEVKSVDSGLRFSVKSEIFRNAVHEVAFAAKENSARPILSGVFFAVKEGALSIVATDSYRLSERCLTLADTKEEKTFVVPVRAVMEADRLAATADSISVVVSENQVSFSADGSVLISRLIDGSFPDYKRIIPASHQTLVKIDREELALAVRRVSIFARENNQHMKWEVGKDELIVSTDSTEIGEEVSRVPAKVEGSANLIALSADYVLDVLGALSGEGELRIELEGKLQPAVIKKEKEEDFLHLIMPLKV